MGITRRQFSGALVVFGGMGGPRTVLAASERSRRHPTELLEEDHRAIQSIMQALQHTDDLGRRQDDFTKLQQRLQAHLQVEEQVFYPALERLGGEVAREARSGFADHEEMRRLLTSLQTRGLEARNWQRGLEELMQDTLKHVKAEERGMFKHARGAMPADQAAQLADAMEAAWNEMPRG